MESPRDHYYDDRLSRRPEKNSAGNSCTRFSDELRQYIIDTVSVHGGHFAASLGVVELTSGAAITFSILPMTSWFGM